MEQNNFKALLRRTVVIPVIALVLLAAVLLGGIQSLKRSMQWVDHTDQVISSGRQLIKLIIDMETGLRGYLNTGRDEFLEPYNEAKPVIDAKFDAMNQLVFDNPAQQGRLASIRSHFEEWRLLAGRGLELRRNGAVENESFLKRKLVMDSVRTEVDDFLGAEERLRDERVQSARRKSMLVTASGIVLSLSIGLFLAFFTRRQMRMLAEQFRESLQVSEESIEALRDREQQFRTLANAIPQLCWMANADGWITWYNERWYSHTGTTPEQMEGWGWQSVHDPEELPKVMERWTASIATGEPFDMTFPLKGSDGEFRPFLTRVMPVKDGEGKVVRWFGTNTDISEQIETAQALRVSEERYRNLFDTMYEGFCVIEMIFDAEGKPADYRFLQVNAAFRRQTGLHEAEGKLMRELAPAMRRTGLRFTEKLH